jgi:Predicted glutamine amidotransferase involved in pyridoxine biosynthesis
MPTSEKDIVIGVLALQGAFQEHQECQEKGTGCKTVQASSNPLSLWLVLLCFLITTDRNYIITELNS